MQRRGTGATPAQRELQRLASRVLLVVATEELSRDTSGGSQRNEEVVVRTRLPVGEVALAVWVVPSLNCFLKKKGNNEVVIGWRPWPCAWWRKLE